MVRLYNEEAVKLGLPTIDEGTARAVASSALDKIKKTTLDGGENEDLVLYR